MSWAIYARKSDDDKKVTEKSIADQVRECRLLGERDDLPVVVCYEESQSAKIPGKRPLFNELLKRIERGEVQGILCWNVNRLARNMAEGGMLAHLMAEGKLCEIRTPTSVFRTGDNIIPLVVETGTSTQYSLEVVRNVSRGMKGHFERGGTTYKAPAGYRNARDPDNLKRGIVIKDEPRFTLIRRAFDHVLTGAYGIEQTRTFLNNTLGYKSRTGRPMSLPSLCKVLRDPFYAGFARYKGQLQQGAHEPMLTTAEFARVQEILEGMARSKKPKRGPRYAYTGLIRCAYCRQQVTADTRRMMNGQPYVSYHCADSWGRCTKKGLSDKSLDAAFAAELQRIQVDPYLVGVTLRTILRALDEKYASLAGDRDRYEADLAAMEKKLWRVEQMYVEGLFDSEERYRAHLEAVKGERERFTVRSAGARLSLAAAKENARNAARFIVCAGEAFQNGDAATRREIISALATGYFFHGREKRLGVDLNPLIEEISSFARSIRVVDDDEPFDDPSGGQPEVRTSSTQQFSPFELPETGSDKEESTTDGRGTFLWWTRDEEIRTGTEHSDWLNAPDALVELVSTELFPDLHLSEGLTNPSN